MASPKTKTSNKKPPVRRVKQQPYRSFRLQQRIKHPGVPLPAARRILWRSIAHLRKNWRIFTGITFIYLALTIIFVKGLGSTTDLGELKQVVEEIFVGKGASALTGLTLFSVLLGSAGAAPDEVSGAYQTILLIIVSLVLIWTLRQTYAKTKIGLRDAYYKSLYPLIPFMLVLAVIGLQLLPLGLVNALYGFVFEAGLAVTGLEQALWALILFFLCLLSLYMLTSSLFALYIVTLPDMRPMMALKTARELVRYRRWTVMRKVFFLPVALVILGALITVPIILYATPFAEWVFFVLNMAVLAIVHSYMYTLYRELI